MSTQYERVEDIPPKTCYSVKDRGTLLMVSSGVPGGWMRADLKARHVTSNTHNNR